MIGLGTIVNVAAIAAGGLAGISFGKVMPERIQRDLIGVCGVLTIFLGIGGVMSEMLRVDSGALTTGGTMMMIASLLIGTIIGAACNLEKQVERFGAWLRKKTHNERDSSFINAFVTASLTVCIGAMAIIGSIQDGIYGDHTVLFTKAILDFVIVTALAAAMGIGAAFSAIPVAVVQGGITALAALAAPVMTDAAMSNLSYVGSILIACVGVNLLWPKKISVANMLPALVIAIVWAFLPWG